MNTTDNNQTRRSPNGGPGHMRDTGAYPTVPLMEALAKRGVHVQTPPAIQPEQDEATVPMPTPIDPAAANANSTHIWPVGNTRPSPTPRPAAPPVDVAPAATRPDWRDRLLALPLRTRVATGVVLAAVLVVAAVIFGVVK